MTEILTAVLASLFTALLLRALGTQQEVVQHDREIDALNEDLRRWVRDSDRERRAALRGTVNRSDPYAGSTLNALRHAAEGFREAWRNESSVAMRRFWKIVDAEGRLHELGRRRAKSRPALLLPPDVLKMLEESRELVQGTPERYVTIEDPAHAALEPAVADFERGGEIPFPLRNLLTGLPHAVSSREL